MLSLDSAGEKLDAGMHQSIITEMQPCNLHISDIYTSRGQQTWMPEADYIWKSVFH